jgi:hypothetical protein
MPDHGAVAGVRPDPSLAVMSATRSRSKAVAACYCALAILHFAWVAGLVAWTQNGSREAMWWELTESSASRFYAVVCGVALVQLVMAALSLRFAERPKAVRWIVMACAFWFFLDSLLGPLLSILVAAGLYRPASHSLQVLLAGGPPPLVVLAKFMLALIYWFCAYQLLLLHRSVHDRLDRR